MKTRTQSVIIVITLLFLGFLTQLQGVSPAPDGCYPNFTTVEGCDALNLLTTGAGNTGLGWRSLFLNTTGSFNTSVGGGALALNNADSNTAVGAAALLLNTTGTENTAIGTDALVFNDSGGFNSAVGAFALFSNTTGSFNTAYGQIALVNNTEGNDNTAIGAGGLADNIDGSENVAIGLNALANNSSGSNNVALGNLAGFLQSTGSNNVYIGDQIEGTTGESNACYIASIFGQTAAGGSAVFVDANSKLGTLSSSKCFKEEIQQMGTASKALFALKPVTFHYKEEIDPAGKSQFGLVAEDVENVNPDLIVRDKEGKAYSVRYDQVNAMLLNEFLKEHRTFVEQERKVAQQEKEIEALKADLKEQRLLIEKVSAKLEVSQPPTKVAARDP